MIKFFYRLCCPGTKNYIHVLGVIRPLDSSIKCIYFDAEQYVVALNEEIARNEIRKKLKNKWDGFIITRKREI